jgi:hypothetical protein
MFCWSLFVLLFFSLSWPLSSLVLSAMFCWSLFVLLFFHLNWPLSRRTNNDLQNIALKTKEHNDQFKLKYKNRRTNNDLFSLNWSLSSLVLSAMFCRSLFVLFFNLNWPLCSLVSKEHNDQFKLKNRRTNNDLQSIEHKAKEHNGQFKWKNRRTNNDLQNIALKTKESLVLSAMFCRSLFVLLFLYFNLNWSLCSLVLSAMFCRSLFVLLFFHLNSMTNLS